MSVLIYAPTGDGLRRRLGATAYTDVVLAAHGSRDPRAADDTRRLVAAVAHARPDLQVRAAYLDFAEPALGSALRGGGDGGTLVVPLLLTPAYHARVDVPGVVDAARDRGLDVTTATVLGPVDDEDPGLEYLVSALERRVGESSAHRRPDAVVLGAAGSRDVRALATVDRVARALGERLGAPCRAGYASGAGRSVASAVDDLHRDGAQVIAYAALFLANGRLPDRAAESARAAGVRMIAEPLVDAPELAELIGTRIDVARRYRDS